MPRPRLGAITWLPAAALALTVALSTGCRSIYPAPERQRTTTWVSTPDGWSLALHHFPAAGPVKHPSPVILCHGISSNRHTWELGDRALPGYLAARGFDVWVVELRGAGRSRLQAGRPWATWSYDEYATTDLPTIVNHLAARSPTGRVQWVGHSMGSMVVYGYLQRVSQAKIRSVVAVGSPPYVFDNSPTLAAGAALLPVLSSSFKLLPSGTLARLGSALAHPAWLSPLSLIWNDRNMAPAVARAAAANAVDDVPSRLILQFARSRRAHRLRSWDRKYDYTRGMKRIRTPIFFIAGALDQLAPPAVLLEAYARISSTDKRIEILSRANGYRADYGHVDMAMGTHAPDEVFPLIARWLADHDR